LNLALRLWQAGGASVVYPLQSVAMKSKTVNGVTVAHAQKTSWIGLVS
jgi:hypothetical protein